MGVREKLQACGELTLPDEDTSELQVFLSLKIKWWTKHNKQLSASTDPGRQGAGLRRLVGCRGAGSLQLLHGLLQLLQPPLETS